MKWEKIKEIGPAKLLVIVVAGILLLIMSCTDTKQKSGRETANQLNATPEPQTEASYRRQMEEQVVRLLEKVEGVGKAEVMITIAASKEKVTLKDNEISNGKSMEETVLVEDSDNNASPYVLQEKEPVPEGILVVCEGGGDPAVSREIIGAIQVLFHAPAHKIKVMKMEP